MRYTLIAVTVVLAVVVPLHPVWCLTIKRGDLLVQSPFNLQVRTPAGAFQGTFPLPFSSNYRALAASSGYAALLQSTVELQDHRVVIVQLGSSPRVVGTVKLPGIPPGCAPYVIQTGSSLALTQKAAAGGATVLGIFLDVACDVGAKPACSDGLQSAAYQNVGKQLGVWSWTIGVKAGRLVGSLQGGPRATLNSDRCLHKESRGLGVVNGTVYATYSYGAAPNREVTVGFGIFKIVPTTAKTAQLTATYRFNTFAFAAVPTGPTSAVIAHLQLCSFARGRGKQCGGPFLPAGSYYQSIAAKGADAYALVTHTATDSLDGVTVEGELVRLSGPQLRVSDRGSTLAQLDFSYARMTVVP